MIDITRVRERLEELGLNQHQAALQSGLPQDYIRDILRGRNQNPAAHKLRALALTLNCSPDYLLGLTSGVGNEYPKSKVAITLVQLTVRHRVSMSVQSTTRGLRISYSYWMASAGQYEDEWLEQVADFQNAGRLDADTLIHVVTLPTGLKDGDLVVAQIAGPNRSTFTRFVTEYGSAKLQVQHRGPQYVICGWVVRAHRFFDGSHQAIPGEFLGRVPTD